LAALDADSCDARVVRCAKREQAKENSCGKGGCRYSMTSSSITKRKTAASNYPKWAQARTLYKKLQDIVFSREFESALFKKLGVTKVVKTREFRILSDKHGYSNGRIHTDLGAGKVSREKKAREGPGKSQVVLVGPVKRGEHGHPHFGVYLLEPLDRESLSL